jgi:uncharacterized membrane protein (UPF0127 family)
VNWKKHIITFMIVFLVASLLFRPGACMPGGGGSSRPPDARIAELRLDADRPPHLSAESYVIRAEVADTPQKRQQGLTDRRGIEPGYGVLYVYAEPEQPRFSGAGNRFPVSQAFIREDGVIVRIERTPAGATDEVIPEEPVKFVLEVREGWFEDRNVQAGARLILPADLAARQPAEAPAAEPAEAPSP